MSLYQKYRPKEFEEMYGNREEIESLEKKFSGENRPHAYLFQGESGCGKTTAARICADKLGAGPLSIVEINSSDNRGIDTARQIINQIKTYPNEGDCWVFIIDEVHMATKEWQNAMLKPLEDTPDHVYFFLCTTDPQKLIKTLKTRCSIFNFPALNSKLIYKLLFRVNKKEKIGLDKEVLEEISDNSYGSPRRALTFLEKVKDLGSEKALKLVSSGLDEEENKQTIELCRALLKSSSWGEISDIIKGLTEEPERIRRAILGYMGAVLLKKKNDKAAVIMEYFSDPFYNTGKPGLVLACYQSLYGE